jgi:hypothetical protein
MEPIEHPLPLRLIPRKDSQVLPIFCSLLFLGVIWLIALKHSPMTLVQKHGPIGYLYLLLFAIFFLATIGVLAVSVMKLLPRSPYYYLEIARGGIVLRQGVNTKRFAWSDVSPFVVHIEVITTRNKYGGETKTTYYYVVAVPAADVALLQDEGERLSRAIFNIVADEYGAGSNEQDASALADWLTEIRSDALANSGQSAVKVAVPPQFRDTVVSATVQPASPLAKKRASVIERRS